MVDEYVVFIKSHHTSDIKTHIRRQEGVAQPCLCSVVSSLPEPVFFINVILLRRAADFKVKNILIFFTLPYGAVQYSTVTSRPLMGYYSRGSL
jgi:hypothetical protein